MRRPAAWACGVAVMALLAWTLASRAAPATGALGQAPSVPPAAPAAPALIAELGCGACHAGVPAPEGMATRAPALDHAGLRYAPAYLYAFLRDPRRVRRHIGAARMPDFHLDERESLALTLYLSTLREDGGQPDVPGMRWPRLRRPRATPEGDALLGELGCSGCHALGNRGGDVAPELTTAGARLNPDWLRRYLVAPHRWDPGTPMPALFFTQDASGELRERTPDAARRLNQVVDHLTALGAERRAELERQYDAAKRRHPQVSGHLGRAIFLAQNCAGCHTRAPARSWRNAPDLRTVAARVRPEWLREYLVHPVPVRPFGFYPGSGSRMPDFRLSAGEAEAIHAYLVALAPAPTPPSPPPPLTAYQAAKAETLLQERLPCLGCHALDGKGGRIGPDLSAVGGRLRSDWLAGMIDDPQGRVPGTMMPRTAMPQETRALITAYLAGRDGPAPPAASHLSLVDHPLRFPRGGAPQERLYGRYCAACHGPQGGGDGYNARYLPTLPTVHAADYLATRPDDVLFDGIHAGGAILDRSPRMPGFGHTLSSEQIRGLVDHLRALCQCEGPAWSRDGGGAW